MEHFTVKQEDTGEEAMDISSGLIPDDYVGTGQLGGLEVEIDLMKGKLDGDKHNYVEIASSSGQMNQVSLITLSNNMQPGEQQQQLTIPNNQIVMASSGNGQSVMANKNQLVNNSQTVTKLVITKNTSDRSQCVLSVGPEGLQQIARNSVGQNLIGQPGVVTTLANSMENSIMVTQGLLTAQPAMLTTSMPVSSPTKTYVLSPQKHATAPIKYTVSTAAKLPVSPAKTSPKRTVISASSLQKSPQRVTQVPGGHQYMMLTCPPSANTSKVNTITMSPSKGTKGQAPVSIVNVQQPQYSTSQNQSLLQTSQPNNINMSNVPSNIRPVSVTGSKFQYVRLVAAPTTQKQTNQVSRPPTIAPAPQRVVTPAASQGPIKVAVPLNSNQPIHPKQSNQSQRLILPATSQPVNQGLQPAVQANTNTLLTSGVNAAQTINLQGLPGFALIQTQYIAQPQNQTQLSQPLQAKQDTYQAAHQTNTAKHNTNGHSVTTESLAQRPRKPCNCTKSQCLKLYCDCFANGEFCSNCNCSNCYNNLDHEEERQRAIKTCLERNPHAFHPKIGKGRGGTGDRRHNKGCNCKRSGCLKNYCECYEAKIMCSSLCKCVGCKNYEESSDRKTLMHLADAAEVRHQQQTAVKTKLSTQIQELTPRQHPATAGERLPYTFVTAEVAEATCACLVAQAEEAERTRQQEMVEEKMILQEFGRCLMQVIQSATSTRAPSPVP